MKLILKHKVLALVVASAILVVAPMAMGKGKPITPPEEESGNNLSTPGVLMETVPASSILASWLPPNPAALGVNYSYGCDKPESDGKFSYPNTSCVDNLATPTVYYTAEQCTDNIMPSPCEGLPVSRMYWQKVAVNDWSADAEGALTSPPTSRAVAYNNWGDALEAVSWTETSQVRVENQPYESLIPGFDPTLATCADAATAAALDPTVVCKVGIQVWHVSGQGITEQWGAVATDLDPAVSYNFDSPFQIINTGTARLNVAKMEAGTAVCPAPGEGDDPPDPPPALGGWTGSGWTGACTWRDATFSIELSVSGKYVYGYNWPLKTVELLSACGPGWLKTGWWRLTFYTTGGAVAFEDATAPVTAPPDVPAEARSLPRAVFNTALAPLPDLDEESEALYTPVIDTINNLTYIDVCVTGKTKGGGGGKPK